MQVATEEGKQEGRAEGPTHGRAETPLRLLETAPQPRPKAPGPAFLSRGSSEIPMPAITGRGNLDKDGAP